METFSSEIGKKMRNAVKAKLIELGTEGGTSGYVDDELPDYVMIMVANKRSKQQMTSDLTLFLGSKTELFVTWLHEVLQKLQEVTIPVPPVAAKKRKSGQKEDASSKKDKKVAKKEKKPLKKTTENPTTKEKTTAAAATTTTTATENPTVILPPTGSIRDVFAEELLIKAKHNLEVAADAANQIKKGKSKKTSETETKTKEGNEFDIPTITEISSTTAAANAAANNNVISGDREKDLAELAEIQKKIYAAKKHLRELGELKDFDDDNEDFLKLCEEGSCDGLSDINAAENEKQEKKKESIKEKSPIVFEKNNSNANDKNASLPVAVAKDRESSPHIPSAIPSKASQNSSMEKRPTHISRPNDRDRRYEPQQPQRSRDRERREASPPPPHNRRPIHERLGAKPQTNNSEQQRQHRREKELYVPAHRRQDGIRNEKPDNRPERWRSRERDDSRRSHRSHEQVERSRERERERERDRSETRFSSANTRRQVHEKLQEQKETPMSADEEDEEVESPRETSRHRVSSRVIVTTTGKPMEKRFESSDEEELNDKPVNSVIKIKPRPNVSPSRQACKNLLLRAVAEAQRSTILSKTTKKPDSKKSQIKARLGKTVESDDEEEILAKKLRERRLKRSGGAANIGASTLFRRQTQNFLIKVDGDIQSKRRRLAQESPTQRNDNEEVEEDELEQEGIGTTLSVILNPHIKENSYEEEDDDEEEEEYVNYGPQVFEEEDVDADIHTLIENDDEEEKTPQFVVTLNDEKATQKYGRRLNNIKITRTTSPAPQVTSSSSVSFSRNLSNEPTSTSQFSRSRPRESRRSDIRSRLSKRPATPLSPSRSMRLKDRDSNNSSSSFDGNTPPPRPPTRASGSGSGVGGGGNRKTKDVKKIIIKNDTDDDCSSSPLKRTPEKEHHLVKRSENSKEKSPERRSKASTPNSNQNVKESTVNESPSPAKKESRHVLIKFDLDTDHFKRNDEHHSPERERERERERGDGSARESKSAERSFERQNSDDKRRISIRKEINNKYDNIPSLSSIALDSNRGIKPKERCKYHPNCTKQFCDFYHPTAPCKAFPNCKYGDQCMYSHPKCKYDMACTVLDCNFTHSGPRDPSQLQPTAPPLSSHVVPVQNYKSISATAGGSSAMCKYYPNCTKIGCTFYHPKPCRFGKNCINKLECTFYHHELQSSSKFKWVASAT